MDDVRARHERRADGTRGDVRRKHVRDVWAGTWVGCGRSTG
ncbi:hypothetical protein STTU_4608 [Streptomyces sp. Tu6071]|nr:hypothetical protein STTU_4608 [Streptomyces sp. Tu6071]